MTRLDLTPARRPRLRAIILLGGLFLAGCTMGPDYHRPDVETPPNFTEDETWKVAQPNDGLPRGPWWKVYNDATLDHLVEQIAISNQNVASYAAQYRQAVAALGIARSSLLPTVTATLAGTQSQGTSAGGQAIVNGAPITDAVRLGLSASWEIDLWGHISRNIESSQASLAASDAALSNVILSAQATLVQTYFQLLNTDVDIQLLDDTVRSYEKSLKITQDQYEAGVATQVSVAQAKAQLESTRAQWVDLKLTRAKYEHAIALLIGKPPEQLHLDPVRMLPPVPDVPTTVPSALLQRRPDIASAERNMAATNAQIGVAQAAFFPTLTLGASTGFQNTSINNLISSPNNYWSIGPSLAMTIFNYGGLSAQKENVTAIYEQSVATYRQTVLTAFQQVEDNLAAQTLLAQETGIQELASRAADQALELTMNQYLAGTVSYLNVVTTQTTALTARKTLIDLWGRRLVAHATLVPALGGDWR